MGQARAKEGSFNFMVKLFLKSFDLEKAPPVIEVEFEAARVVYLKQEGGYCGVVFRGGRKHKLAHFVHTTGEQAGWVSPPSVTNLLGQERSDHWAQLPHEKYQEVIRRAVTAIIQASIEDAKEDEPFVPSNINKMLAIPSWIIMEPEDGTEWLQRATMAGVHDFLVEFAQVAKLKITIDTKALLESRFAPHYVQVVEGEWDETARELSKHQFLRRALRDLAVQDGLTLQRATKKASDAPPRDPRQDLDPDALLTAEQAGKVLEKLRIFAEPVTDELKAEIKLQMEERTDEFEVQVLEGEWTSEATDVGAENKFTWRMAYRAMRAGLTMRRWRDEAEAVTLIEEVG